MKINKLEIKRQLFHLISGIIIVILIQLNIIGIRTIFILLIIIIIFSIISRLFPKSFFYWFIENLERYSDKNKIPGRGSITYLIGILIALILFKKEIALAAILIMVVGDSISPLVGIHFAKTKHILNKKKSLEGTLAGIVASTLAAFIFIPFYQALIASIFAMFIESLEFKKFKNTILDDNITIPLISGLIIYLIRSL